MAWSLRLKQKTYENMACLGDSPYFPKKCPGQQESGVVSICFFVRGCGAVHMLLQKGSFLMTSHARPHWIFFQLVTGFDLHQRLPIDVAPLEGTHIILGQEAQTVWTVALE